MKVESFLRGLALCAVTTVTTLTAQAKLTFHCTFDDASSPLTPLVGEMPDVVTYASGSAIAPVAGLGGCTLDLSDAARVGLTTGSQALTIPLGQAVRIPHGVPTDAHLPWAMAVRFYQPNITDAKKYVIFSNNETKAYDAAIFIKLVNNTIQVGGGDGKTASGGWGYSTSAVLSPDAWHVMAFSFQDGHMRVYIDGQLAYDKPWTLAASWGGRHTLKSHPYIFLSADDSGEDNPMPFDWVKIWDEAEPPELLKGRNPVGLWEFPEGDPTHATIGSDLELVPTVANATLTSSAVMGLVPGDGAMRLGQWTAYRVRHGLQNQPYTVVIDAKMPSGVTRPNAYHALWHENGAKHKTSDAKIPDATIALKSSDTLSPKRVRFWGDSGMNTLVVAEGRNVYEDEWVRYVITWDGTTRSFYANGSLCYASTRPSSLSTNYSYLHGDLDGQGEESPLDFSTLALYEGAMSADEVALLGGPVGTPTRGGDNFDALPAGEWVMSEKTAERVPSRIGEDLSVVADGYEWPPVSATALENLSYVIDLQVGLTFAGGTLIEAPSGKSIEIDATGRIGNAEIGWSEPSTLDSDLHRIVIANTGASGTDVFVDGVNVTKKPLGKFVDGASTTTQVFRFLNPSGASITFASVSSRAVTPVSTMLPLDFDPSVSGTKAQPTIGTVAFSATGVVTNLPVTVTVPCTDATRSWYATEIDFGDGARQTSGILRYGVTGYGGGAVYSHAYAEMGSFDVRVRTYDAYHRVSAWTTAGTIVVRGDLASEDVLLTWPWQQNVYTNRFTVMCEAKTAIDGLELQWGEDFAQTAPMTVVKGNGGTFLYTARVTAPDQVGATLSYRLAVSGVPLTGRSTTGTVRLWPDNPDESFSCAVWSDNQQGTREGDWDADTTLFARRIFAHLSANEELAFGITAGDMATSAIYATQIKPLNLDLVDTLFASTRPYYVAWGNHDTQAPAVKPYFETGAADEPGYGSSDCGNYHLYRGNVLFIFIDYQLRDTAETVTWLTDLLATPRAQQAKFRVLVQHFPIFGETGNICCDALLDVVKNGGVDLVLSGHEHAYERIEKDGFVQLTYGGLGCLDHHETIVTNYGDATKAGGHNAIPYLWARQRSFTEKGVLGPAEPVRMGLVQGYGELSVAGGVLAYKAHGFNADGSYIGVFDTFAITSKTVAATAPAAVSDGSCDDPSTFAAFTEKPVTNAKWKEFADAVGLAFTYPEGAGDCAVTGISKNEIGRFLAWLNGSTATYRLPTVGELAAAFDGNLARDVSEWSASVDAATGRCLILGGNTNALAGTWCRTADRPMIMTADCSANYLGFRLATGTAPVEPTDVLAEALAQVAALENPAAAYRYQGGTLIDITAELVHPSGDLAYSDPVILTGAGDLALTAPGNVAFRGGLAVTKATSVKKGGSGSLTVGGSLKGGPVTSSAGWTLASEGPLVLENVTSDTTGLRFESGDGQVRLIGANILSSANVTIDEESAKAFVAVGGLASLKVRQVQAYDNQSFSIGEGVTLTTVEDVKVGQSSVTIAGLVDCAGFNVVGNFDPTLLGAGTLRTTYIGSCQNSYTRLAISNVVLTSASPWRQNAPKYSVSALDRRDRIQIAGTSVRIASTCDWTMHPYDHYGIEHQFMSATPFTQSPRVIFDTTDADDGVTPRTFVLAPSRTAIANEPYLGKWGFDVIGSGTLVLDCPYGAIGACRVLSGTLRLVSGQALATAALTVDAGGTLELAGANALGDVAFSGGTLSLPNDCTFTGSVVGPLVLDQSSGARLTMGTGLSFTGAMTRSATTDKVRLCRLLGANPSDGIYTVLTASGLTEKDLDLTHDAPTDRVTVLFTGTGDVSLLVAEEKHPLATWIGGGDRANPNDARNWTVIGTDGKVIPEAVPDAQTYLLVSGETALNVPAGTSFACGGIFCSDSATLVADCDWRGIGNRAVFRAGSVLNLNGHTLALTNLAGTDASNVAEITDRSVGTDSLGELCLDVPASVTVTNDSVRLSGNLRFIKKGEGTFAAGLTGQVYTGGTRVEKGTLLTAVTAYYSPCGSYKTEIVVAQGAVFDRNGRSGLENYRLVLDGGTLTCSYNADPALYDHKGNMGDLVLTADSRIAFDTSLTGHGNVKDDSDVFVVSNSVWNLNGYTLDIVFDGTDPDFYVERGVKIRNGLIRTTMAAKGWFHDRGIDGREGASLDLGTILRLNASGTYSTISNLTIRTTSNNVVSEGYQKVYGTYRPVSDYAHKVEFQDGATIDVSERKTVWSLTPGNGASGTAIFANNATIAIKPPANVCGETRVIAWESKPANLDTLTFVKAKDAQCRGKIRVRENGVYLEIKGMVLLVK